MAYIPYCQLLFKIPGIAESREAACDSGLKLLEPAKLVARIPEICASFSTV